MRSKNAAFRTFLFGASLGAALLLSVCSNPTESPGDDEPKIPVGEPLGSGLYSFTGDSPPRETGESIVKIPVLPFTAANALAVIDAEIEDPPEDPEPGTLPPPKNYLLILDRDALLQSWTLKGSFTLTIRGLATERVIQLYNAGASEEVEERNYESLFVIRDGASLVLEENIALVGSLANSAPLVSVDPQGTLAMNDGAKIQNNSAGGVRVQGRLARFTMHGGEISGCVLTNASVWRHGGAGVQLLDGGAFTMKGGVIRNNHFTLVETRYNASGGGGVCRVGSAGPFIMEGGEITGNHSDSNSGGVFGDFTIRGGKIRWNTSDDPNPLLKNIQNTPAAEGEDFIIEGWNEPYEIILTEKGDAGGRKATDAETGSRLEFSAVVVGVGSPSQQINWSILEPHNVYTKITDGTFVVGPGETASGLTVRAASAVKPEVYAERAVTVTVYHEPRLWVKFEMDSPHRAAELFNALHDYIQSGELDGGNPRGVTVGDYYDLPRLDIPSDGVAAAVSGNNTFMGDGTGIFRVVIVGINSFRGINGNTGSHVVFQFRNAVVSRRMNQSNTNVKGYPGSEARTYLTDYFLPGLIASGIPENTLWNPVRVIAKGGTGEGTDTVSDYLWLPAALEMNAFALNELLGFSGNNARLVRQGETRENQALLEYYASATDADSAKSLLARRDMDDTAGIAFSLASPGQDSACFAALAISWISGAPNFVSTSSASTNHGIIPAFCVK